MAADARDLSVQIGSLRLANPLIAASGCFGYGVEYAGTLDLSTLGGKQHGEMVVTCKFATRHNDATSQQIAQIGGTFRLGAELFEKGFQFTHTHCLEQHVTATGKQSVDRGPRDARPYDDVVDGDVGKTARVYAFTRRFEHRGFVTPHV